MKIQKQLPVQTEEVEITLPAYYKNTIGYYYKIHEDETVSVITSSQTNMLIISPYSEPVQKVVTQTPITEKMWKDALGLLADHFGQFMCLNGLTESGYQLPEPKDLNDNYNNQGMRKDLEKIIKD